MCIGSTQLKMLTNLIVLLVIVIYGNCSEITTSSIYYDNSDGPPHSESEEFPDVIFFDDINGEVTENFEVNNEIPEKGSGAIYTDDEDLEGTGSGIGYHEVQFTATTANYIEVDHYGSGSGSEVNIAYDDDLSNSGSGSGSGEYPIDYEGSGYFTSKRSDPDVEESPRQNSNNKRPDAFPIDDEDSPVSTTGDFSFSGNGGGTTM